MKSLKIRKYGSFWKLPFFTLFSMIPFSLLYEETPWFWLPFYFFFLTVITTKRIFPRSIVPVLFSVGAVISWIHHAQVARIDLLFFARLLLFIQAGLHLMRVNRQRVIVMYFLNFVLILVAGALTFRFWFALYALVFFFALGYLFLELSFQRFHAEVEVKFKAWYTAKLVFFLLLCGYALFLFVPRLHFDQIPSQLGLTISGFSDQVSLDDITSILESDKVVMRVKTRGSPGYYKGVVLDSFDGKSWHKSSKFRPLRSAIIPGEGMKIPSLYHDRFQEVQEFDFQVLPSKNKYVFLPEFSRSLEIEPPLVEVSLEGDIRRKFNLRRSLEYKVYAYKVKRSRSLLKEEPEIGNFIKKYYLQLPGVSPRVEKLAHYITREKTTYLERVKAIRAFFDKSFRYSLDSYHPGDPLEDFLLNNRVGHCQYYAAAMVLLLRLNNIPARMVNGFTSGEYNEYGDYWTIRMKDAHAWVEVFAGEGIWIIEDPTPAQPLSWFQSGILQSTYQHLKKIGEYFDAQWQSSVLYFSRVDQSLFLLNLLRWWKQSPLLNSILALVGIFLFFALVHRFFRSFEIRYEAQNEWIKKLDKWLISMDFQRPPSKGLQEHLETLNLEHSLHETLSSMQDRIYRMEFRNGTDDKELEQELKVLWKRLKGSSRTRRV
ncbi:DUF3488 domain-containing protein [bacterium]|nr:DUF3488 domain-containing protein [bacterium]